jgi:biotin transport system substrate-specific component
LRLIVAQSNLNAVHLTTVQVSPKGREGRPMTTMSDQTAEQDAPTRRRFTTTDLALIAAFAALMCVCGYAAAIPVGSAGVPITLQTFAIVLTGLVLGPVRGFVSVGLYLLLGLAGLPVFASHASGPGAFTGASSGYLWTFLLVPLVAGAGALLLGRLRTHALLLFVAALAATVVNHIGGIVGLHQVIHAGWHQAIVIDGPYWPGDILKSAVAAIVAAEVHRAFPALLGRVRPQPRA